MGAAIKAPKEPAADTMPSTVLRKAGDTGLEATAMAMAEAAAGEIAAVPSPSTAPATVAAAPTVCSSDRPITVVVATHAVATTEQRRATKRSASINLPLSFQSPPHSTHPSAIPPTSPVQH